MTNESSDREAKMPEPIGYFVDEAGDGVLFGPKGRNRLEDKDARRFFILGMVRLSDPEKVESVLQELRAQVLSHPLYASIHTLRPEVGKTARFFHAKDDHAEVRAKVFETLLTQDFKFYAVIKDMRAVLDYVRSRNQMNSSYRYHPNELYDLTVRMLFKHRLHQHEQVHITFARRGKSDRTASLRTQLELARKKLVDERGIQRETTITILPAHPWDAVGLQVADYCLWALQRCYENHEARFLHAIWPKVSLIHDVDDKTSAEYGRYWTRKNLPPDPEAIKNRWI
jgi:hypothetical protein